MERVKLPSTNGFGERILQPYGNASGWLLTRLSLLGGRQRDSLGRPHTLSLRPKSRNNIWKVIENQPNRPITDHPDGCEYMGVDG